MYPDSSSFFRKMSKNVSPAWAVTNLSRNAQMVLASGAGLFRSSSRNRMKLIAVRDLVFCLFIAEIVKALQNEDLEHQDEIVPWAAAMLVWLGWKNFLEFRTEVFPVDVLFRRRSRSPRIVRRLRRFCSSKLFSPKCQSCIGI